MIPLTRAIPEHIRGGYDDATFTLHYFTYCKATIAEVNLMQVIFRFFC